MLTYLIGIIELVIIQKESETSTLKPD